MSIEQVAAALPRRGITPTQKLVLIGIANHDGDGGAWPSIETLAGYAEVSPRQVQKIIRQLVELGLVTVHDQAGGNSRVPANRRPNLYHLHFTGVSPTTPHPDAGVSPSAPRGVTQRGSGVSPATPKPSSNHPEPSASVFDKFWDSYPRRVGKPAAQRAWATAITRDGLEPIRDGFRRWMRHWNVAHTELQFIPHPATWLNQRRYMDDPGSAPGERPQVARHEPADAGDLADAAFGRVGL